VVDPPPGRGPGGRGFESRRSPLVKSLVSADSADNRTGRSSATGTDAHASTSGSAVDAAGDEPPIRFRGDELDLYAEFHFELLQKISRNVRATPEAVEDACAHAWVEFLKHQPSREMGSWRGWLYRTAEHEAWRLNAVEWKERSVADSGGEPLEPPDPRDRYEERLEFQAALQELRKLPPQME
jgi:hypothetical protein